MPSRRLRPDTALVIRLDALISRAGYNWSKRPVADDVADIVEVAGERLDLLAQSVGLSTEAWPTEDLIPRRREVAAALHALDLPDVERWFAVARERRLRGNHTTESFDPRSVDLPGLGRFRPGELPGF